MKKTDFMTKLHSLIGGCAPEDVAEAMQYYGEMIDERVENGENEEDVVASLGYPEDIAGQLNAECEGGESLAAYQEAVSRAGVTKLTVHLFNNAVSLEPSPDECVHVYYRERISQKYRYEERGNEVTFTDKPKNVAEIALDVLTLGLLHIHRFRTVRVQIPVSFCGQLAVTAGNGKIYAAAPGAASSVRLHAGNGKIVWSNCRVSGDVYVNSANGSVTVSDVCGAGMFDCHCSNGRVTFLDSAAAELSAASSNGRVSLQNVTATERLTTRSSNGAVLLTGVACPNITAHSSNGRIETVIYGEQPEYRMDLKTSNGTITVQGLKVMSQVINPSAPKKLNVDTSNGRISVIFRGKPEPAGEECGGVF